MGLSNLPACNRWLEHVHSCPHGCGTAGGTWCREGMARYEAMHNGMTPEESLFAPYCLVPRKPYNPR
jgi:hypothetical protein